MKHLLTLGCATAFVSLSPFASRTEAATPPAQSKITVMAPDAVAHYDSVRPDADFIKRVVMIPMRDGVKLYTVIVMKKGTAGGPILFSRTPYDAKESTARTNSQSILDILPAMDAEFVEDNYIRVLPGHPRHAQLRGRVHHDPADYRATELHRRR